MGIRVNKVIGYGVKNLKPDDPRVDWKELHHPERREKRYDTDMSQFIRWLQRKKVQERLMALNLREYPGIDDGMRRFIETDIKFLIQNIKTQMKNSPTAWLYLRGGPSACLVHEGEGSKQNVMVFLQPDCPDWHRHDDIMDYYEETRSDGPSSRVVDLTNRGGIHPYNSAMIRFRKPSKGVYEGQKKPFESKHDLRVDEHGLVSMGVGTYNQLVGRWDPKMKPWAKGKFLAHLRRSWRPKVPLGVLAVMLWHDCFPNLEKFIDDLRPMIYVWWG